MKIVDGLGGWSTGGRTWAEREGVARGSAGGDDDGLLGAWCCAQG